MAALAEAPSQSAVTEEALGAGRGWRLLRGRLTTGMACFTGTSASRQATSPRQNGEIRSSRMAIVRQEKEVGDVG